MSCYRTVMLLLALSIAHSASASIIQPKPAKGPLPHDDSILDKMSSDVEASSRGHGVCKFPPKSVLHEFKTYPFFEMCNRKIPSNLTPHTPDEDVLCMGLYELGLRLCSFATKYHLPFTSIPSNPLDFKELLMNLNQTESDANVCSEFENEPPPQSLEKQSLESQIEGWNILRIFNKQPGICRHICFYYNGDANELCQLILWGNKLMINAIPAPGISQVKSILSSDDRLTDDYSQGNIDIGVDQSSRESHNEPKIEPKDSPSSPIVSSLSHDSTSASKKVQPEISDVSTVNIRADPSSHAVSSKNVVAAKIIDGEKQKFVQVEPLAGLSDSTRQYSLANGKEADQNSNKSSSTFVENVQQKILENTLHESNEKKVDEGQDTKKSVQVHLPKELKILPTVSSSALPVTVPTASAPEVIVQDTASIPSAGANEETMRVEDFSKDYDANLDQGEDDIHFPAVGIDQPIKADENVNGEDDFLKTRGDINYVHDRFEESEDSHFFRYFVTMVVFCIFGYLLFHNKQKILALFLEGRSRRSNRRRPNTANYHKLDSNLEEAVSSPCNTSVAHVIY